MANAGEHTFEAGDIIFREGESGEVMFILLEGAVELSVKVDKGEAVIKTVDTPNDFFGEMALLDEAPRSASAKALVRTRLLVVDGPSFESMILQNGRFALKIIKVLSERIRTSNERVSDLIETLPRERIARGMADFAIREGERIHDGSYKVAIEPMKAWINGHLGVPLDELETALFRFLKTERVSYAATSAKTKEHLLLPESFVRENDRRGMRS
jgi:CRP/FNR family transcriptional regulator, cyclic AMP receptor protein